MKLFWERNDSKIAELFFGIFRSSTTCPTCENVSLKFEPFNMLSLPIKAQEGKEFSIYFMSDTSLYYLDKCEFSIKPEVTLEEIQIKLAEHKKVPTSRIELYEFAKDSSTYLKLPSKLLKTKALDYTPPSKVFLFAVETHSELLPCEDDSILIRIDVQSVSKSKVAGVVKLLKCNRRCRIRDLYCFYFECLRKRFPNYFSHSFESYFESEGNRPFDLYYEGKFLEFVLEEKNMKKTETEETTDTQSPQAKETEQVVQPKEEKEEGEDKKVGQVKEKESPQDDKKVEEQKMDVTDPQLDNLYIELEDNCTIMVHLLLPEVRRHNVFNDLRIERDRVGNHTCISIYDCLNKLTEDESLDDQNKWYCSKCKAHKKADMQYSLKQLPPILIIHFKRFKKTYQGLSKNMTTVEFPIQGLDLTDYVQEPGNWKYDLFATVNHYGNLQRGHYIAFTKNTQKEGWVQYDDDELKGFDSYLDKELISLLNN